MTAQQIIVGISCLVFLVLFIRVVTMETFSVEVQVRCNKCRRVLTSEQRLEGCELFLDVEPCEDCLEEAETKGFTEGENSVDVTH